MRVVAVFLLLALCCATYAQMCPGVYEATQVNATIMIPGYWTPYPTIKTVAVNIGLNATNTSTCYIYYDIYASIRGGERGMLPRVTVGPINCDFGLPEFISFGTINNDSCAINGTSEFCCSNICDAGIVALPTGNYPYTYYANFGLLRSITIGQNSNGVYWNGLDQAITLLNVDWNQGTLSSNAVTAVASTTGVTTGTVTFSTTAAVITGTATALTASVTGGDALTTVSAAAVLASADTLATTVAATGSSLVTTTSSASTTNAAAATTAADSALTTAYATITTSQASTTTAAASTTAAVTTSVASTSTASTSAASTAAATTTVAATTTAAAATTTAAASTTTAATTTAAASTTSVAATTTAAAAILKPLRKK